MKKVAYIIPGFGESIKEKPYSQISSFFIKNGINPILIKINWKYRVMSNYIKQFKKQAKIKNPNYIFGFSFGAIIALICANEIKPKKLILCSLSPYFKEDLLKLKPSWIKLSGKRQLEDLKNYSFNKISKKIKSKTILIYGDKEGKETKIKSREANQKIKNSELIVISNARHDISQKIYLDKIKEVISKLK